MRDNARALGFAVVMVSAAAVFACGNDKDPAGSSSSSGGGSSAGSGGTAGSSAGGTGSDSAGASNAGGAGAGSADAGGSGEGGSTSSEAGFGGADGGGSGGAAGSSSGGSSSGMCGAFEAGEASHDPADYCGSHCSPGTYEPYPYGPILSNCYDYELQEGVGVQDDMPDFGFSIRNIALPEPMVAGQPYGFSTENQHWIRQTEFWGTDAECGVGLELLWSGPQSKETIACFQFTPSAAYTHLLMVWKGGGQHYGVTLCPQGSCK